MSFASGRRARRALEVPQRDIECGDRLRGDPRSVYRRAGPEQGLVDPVDVGRVLAQRDVCDLLKVGVLGSAACSFGVGEPHPLLPLLGGDLDEQEDRLRQRLLPPE